MKPNDITPVQTIQGLKIKRDDLYTPFGAGQVNGGKLRQCEMLVDSILASSGGVHRLLTYCSIHSPQAPITAAVARSRGLSCTIVYGGTTAQTLKKLPMPKLSMKYGAHINIAARSGRHNVLYNRTKELATVNDFIVQYGINIIGHGEILLDAVSSQTINLPDNIENLVMTCGSGITASGVIIGINKYGKNIKNVHLVATAPDRKNFIAETCKKYGAERHLEYHDLFNTKGFTYENGKSLNWGGIRLHPHYEAKTMRWLLGSGLDLSKTLFWIVGAEPEA